MNNIREKNYELAKQFMIDNKHQPITHDLVKAIHAKVMGFSCQASEYPKEGYTVIRNPKTQEIRYMSADRNIYPPLILMTNFLNWYVYPKSDLLAIEIAARFHWGFVKIHPFDDGNGRTARILTYHILLTHGYTDVQYQMLEQFFTRDRDTVYIDALTVDKNYMGFESVSDQWLKYMHDCDMLIKDIRTV